jgi:hypothetical protein
MNDKKLKNKNKKVAEKKDFHTKIIKRYIPVFSFRIFFQLNL